MRHSSFRVILLLMVLASIGVLACDLSSLTSLGISQASKPTTQIVAPAPNSQFRDGDEVAIQSISIDATGIVRVELAVDGAVVRADTPPVASGQTSFTLIQKWKAAVGTHTLSVRAFNVSSTASEPAFITIVVNPTVAEVPTLPIIIPTAIPPLGPTPVLPTIPPSGATAAPSATSTATRAPTRPPSSPTISAPPGVYALSIRVEP